MGENRTATDGSSKPHNEAWGVCNWSRRNTWVQNPEEELGGPETDELLLLFSRRNIPVGTTNMDPSGENANLLKEKQKYFY